MTNEEKAVEFDKIVNNKQVNVYAWTLQMAKWKDQLFKAYLEKKLSDMEYARMRILDDYQQGFYDGRESSMREIINELFPKSEEQDNTDNDE